MDTLPITLIVKAPNQQIEDQTIKCETSWTINKLKQHLSEVYPSKPAKHEQKLIYSGQLLSDSEVLKDVLRQYEGQDTHTVHLVCAPRFGQEQQQRRAEAAAELRPPGASSAANTSPQQDHNFLRPDLYSEGPGRVSGVPPQPWPNAAADPTQYAMQLAWMQQAYVQYINQYMQLARSYQNDNNLRGLDPSQVPPMARVAGAAEEQRVEAPRAPPAAEVEPPERDWLDIFYLLSRILVLSSVVYFYSNPLRFFLVLLLGFSLYLYQVGFFRHINNNNNNNTTRVPPGAPQQVPTSPSRLTVVWTFFTTFFASLIPEIPNAV